MTDAQAKWWRQTQSDWSVFVHLRRAGVNTCHLLHYLQMTTEKLGKAYLWRSGRVPSKNHTGFVRFLKAQLAVGYLRRGHQDVGLKLKAGDVDAEVLGYPPVSGLTAKAT